MLRGHITLRSLYDQKELVSDLAYAVDNVGTTIEVLEDKSSYTEYPKTLELAVFNLNIAQTLLKRKLVLAKKALKVIHENQ